MPFNIPPIAWPKIYNMVNLGGIDLATANGSQVPGIYQKITAALTSDHIEVFYNWKFADIVLPPSKVVIDVSVVNQYVINEEILIKSDDTVGIIGFIRIPIIVPLTAEENRVYDIPVGADGFGPVTVEVPAPEPTLVSLNVDENGTYTPEVDVDGFDEVVVAVPAPEPALVSLNVDENGTYTPEVGVDGFNEVVVAVPTPEPTLVSLNVDENGTYTPEVGVDGFDEVTVNVPLPNYNIVPNWYFINPSNVRGQSSYQSTGTISAITGWQLANAKIDITSEGILISPLNANDGYFFVGLSSDASAALLNKTITLSMLVEDVEGHVTATINSNTGMQVYLNVNGVAFYIWRNSATSLGINIGGPLSGMANKHIKAVKIEFGQESTLVDSHGNLRSTSTPDVEYLRCCQTTTII